MLIDADAAPTGARAARRTSRFWAPRPEALDRLEAALGSDVVLLRGPAGVGKTSLLRQFAATLDADPERGVQSIDGSLTSPEALPRIVEAFADGPASHVLLIDNHVEGLGLSTDHLLHLLRADSSLRIVVATRQPTGLESPLIALEFDVQVLPACDLLMTRDEVASVLALNGVESTEIAVDELVALTHGWPALVQLASARLRLEGLPLRTRAEAAAAAAYAGTTFTHDMEERLAMPVTDDVRLLAVAPYITESLADALGLDSTTATTRDLLDHLQSAGFVWPSATRVLLAEPVRERWLEEISARQPALVSAARLRLLDHLMSGGEPLLAAQLAADARQWTTLARVLRRSGPEIWARNADAFSRMLGQLRSNSSVSPVVVDALLALDPDTAASPETPSLAASVLSDLPDAKSVAVGDAEALIMRASLHRAAGRFALAGEASGMLSDALRGAQDLDPETAAEGWYQVAMTFLAMGRLRDASVSMTLSDRVAPPAHRLRARGALAVIALLEGDVRTARSIVEENSTDSWGASPWGEGLRLASAWVLLEAGEAGEARALLDALPATSAARELWPFAASTHILSCLLSGAASDALGLFRTWMARARSTPPSHYQSVQILMTRAKVLIALRQAREALALFEGPFALSPLTAPAIALSQLYAGRSHEAFVMSVKWGLHHEPSPRAALESLVVSVVADVRLNGVSSHRSTVQRAEALSIRHDLWSPWSAVAPEDRARVTKILSSSSREQIEARTSLFASSVSVPRLTKREQVVLSQLTPTSTIADIARALVVSPNTVKTQLQSLYRKLEVSDRSSAIRAAHAWGLIENDLDA